MEEWPSFPLFDMLEFTGVKFLLVIIWIKKFAKQELFFFKFKQNLKNRKVGTFSKSSFILDLDIHLKLYTAVSRAGTCPFYLVLYL